MVVAELPGIQRTFLVAPISAGELGSRRGGGVIFSRNGMLAGGLAGATAGGVGSSGTFDPPGASAGRRARMVIGSNSFIN
jgi:hypothetical protein